MKTKYKQLLFRVLCSALICLFAFESIVYAGNGSLLLTHNLGSWTEEARVQAVLQRLSEEIAATDTDQELLTALSRETLATFNAASFEGKLAMFPEMIPYITVFPEYFTALYSFIQTEMKPAHSRPYILKSELEMKHTKQQLLTAMKKALDNIPDLETDPELIDLIFPLLQNITPSPETRLPNDYISSLKRSGRKLIKVFKDTIFYTIYSALTLLIIFPIGLTPFLIKWFIFTLFFPILLMFFGATITLWTDQKSLLDPDRNAKPDDRQYYWAYYWAFLLTPISLLFPVGMFLFLIFDDYILQRTENNKLENQLWYLLLDAMSLQKLDSDQVENFEKALLQLPPTEVTEDQIITDLDHELNGSPLNELKLKMGVNVNRAFFRAA